MNGEFIASIPSSKGSLTLNVAQLPYTDTTVSSTYPSGFNTTRPQTRTMRLNNGYVLLDNEPYFYPKTGNIGNMPFPFEYWFVGVDLSGFPFESYMNISGMYLGEYGGQLRSTNENTASALFDAPGFPKYQPFLVRMRYNANRRVELWIDGTYKGERDTYLTGTTSFLSAFGIGTDTNNAKWFVGAIAQVNSSLSDADATTAYNSFRSKYGTGQALAYPVIKNANMSQSGNIVSAIGDYFSPTNTAEASRLYRWYSAGTGANAPDVTYNILEPSITTQSFDKSLLPAGTWVRADIEVTDANGLSFKGASGKQYFKIS